MENKYLLEIVPYAFLKGRPCIKRYSFILRAEPHKWAEVEWEKCTDMACNFQKQSSRVALSKRCP